MAKKPNIRFAGFEDDWEQRKLGEVCSEIGDGLHSAPKYNDNGEVFFINGNNLVDGHIVIDPLKTRRVSKETFEKNNKHLDNNTLLLSINGTIGNLAYYQGEQVMLGKSIAYLKVNGIDHFFLYTSLQTAEILNSFMISLTGTTIKNLGLEAIKNTIIAVPKLEEQHKIGVYFSALDHLITLHQRKCDELKKVKKFMLQKMFPKKGEKNPEIRFDGFTNDWEQRKLGDYLEVSKQKNKRESFGREDVLSVSGEFGIVNQIEFQGRSFAGVSVVNYGVVEYGDVVYTKSPLKSNPYGIVKTNKGKSGIVSTLYAVYKPKNNVESEFVQIYFESDFRMNTYMHPLVNKGAKNDMKVSDENALKGPVVFPQIEEQRVISQYFKQLDHLITLHQRKCEELKNVKKYMLQNMFAKGE